MSSTQTAHVDVVDGLRGLAILLVMLFHFWQLSWWRLPLPGGGHSLEFVAVAGALGVELFFFLSAFCLFYPHAKAAAESKPLPALTHYAYRRAIKILPSYWLAIALILLVCPELYPTSASRGQGMDVLMHLAFVHNLFPDTKNSIDGVFWSLGVEIQFYLLFPVIAQGFRMRPWLSFAGLVGTGILFRGWTGTLDFGRFESLNSQLPAFLDLFAGGMLTAYLAVRLRARQHAPWPHRAAFTLIGAAACAMLFLMFDWLNAVRGEPHGYPIWQSRNRPWMALIFLSLTLGSAYGFGGWRRLVANRGLLFLSVVSYNLYIWHQLLARLIKERGWWRADTPIPMDDPQWQWSYFAVSVAASIAFASLVTYAMERPLLHYGVKGCWAGLKRGFSRASSKSLK